MKIRADQIDEERGGARLPIAGAEHRQRDLVEQRSMGRTADDQSGSRAVPGKDVARDVDTLIAEQRGRGAIEPRLIHHRVERKPTARHGPRETHRIGELVVADERAVLHVRLAPGHVQQVPDADELIRGRRQRAVGGCDARDVRALDVQRPATRACCRHRGRALNIESASHGDRAPRQRGVVQLDRTVVRSYNSGPTSHAIDRHTPQSDRGSILGGREWGALIADDVRVTAIDVDPLS